MTVVTPDADLLCHYRSGVYWSWTLRAPHTLLRGEELSTKSGMGGVIARLGGEGLLELDCSLVGRRSRLKLLAWWRVLVWLSWLFDRMRLNERRGHVIAWVE